MSDRAIITLKPVKNYFTSKALGVYMHCDGNPETVQAVLWYCRMKGYRGIEYDPTYAMARIVQVIGNYFDDGLSVGVGEVCALPDTDSSRHYVVGPLWSLRSGPQAKNMGAVLINLLWIDRMQPKSTQLGIEEILRKLSGYGIPVDAEAINSAKNAIEIRDRLRRMEQNYTL